VCTRTLIKIIPAEHIYIRVRIHSNAFVHHSPPPTTTTLKAFNTRIQFLSLDCSIRMDKRMNVQKPVLIMDKETTKPPVVNLVYIFTLDILLINKT